MLKELEIRNLFRDNEHRSENIIKIFNSSRFIANRLTSKYRKFEIYSDVKQIAHIALYEAIKTYPHEKNISFYGWAFNTVRREVIKTIRNYLKYQDKCPLAANACASAMITIDYNTPEEIFFETEMRHELRRAVASTGHINEYIIKNVFNLDENDDEEQKISQYKINKKLNFALNSLKLHKDRLSVYV